MSKHRKKTAPKAPNAPKATAVLDSAGTIVPDHVLDLAIQIGPENLRPIYAAMRTHSVAAIVWSPDRAFEMLRRKDIVGTVVLLDDRTDKPRGPAAFTTMFRRQLLEASRTIYVIPREASAEQHTMLAAMACAGAMVTSIETGPDQVGAWLDVIKLEAPRAAVAVFSAPETPTWCMPEVRE